MPILSFVLLVLEQRKGEIKPVRITRLNKYFLLKILESQRNKLRSYPALATLLV